MARSYVKRARPDRTDRLAISCLRIGEILADDFFFPQQSRPFWGVAWAIVGENDDVRTDTRGKAGPTAAAAAAESPAVIAMCRVLDDTCFRIALKTRQRADVSPRIDRTTWAARKLETERAAP